MYISQDPSRLNQDRKIVWKIFSQTRNHLVFAGSSPRESFPFRSSSSSSSFFFFRHSTRSIHLRRVITRGSFTTLRRTSGAAYGCLVLRFWFTGWGTIPRPVHPPTFKYHSNRSWRPIGMVYLSETEQSQVDLVFV